MKKVILSVLVAGSLVATSCKQEAKEAEKKVENATEAVVEETKKAADAVAEEAKKAVDGVVEEVKEVANDSAGDVKSALEGISIPEFKDPKVGEYLQSYSEYAKEYLAAGKDVVKNAELAKKGVELATKGKEIVGSLDAEAAKKFTGVMSAIQAKMAPAK
ncbi:hypothetical protein [Tenacibaculum amylolyticum]|uniref:hypothetical protein n=1 Tax=Tenacibaculum amylolyticum TaxID=104269 RepID=UPI003895ACB4